MAQLAGHPVIYDILPQTGRFSKAVLANPFIARWFDITEIQNQEKKQIDVAADILKGSYDSEDVDVVKDIYIQSLNGSTGNLTEHYQNIFNHFEKEMDELKLKISNKMLLKEPQVKIVKRVEEIIARVHGVKRGKKLTENDITKQIDAIQELIKEGLWPAPGGAWCSAGVPVYDRMSECGGYPVFKHYDYKGEDVTNFATLDCQTPYYFAYLEDGTFNRPVINYFIDYMQKLRDEYNFDGFRVDHIDHIVDKVSEKDGKPISYRAPRAVLNELNTAMKKQLPYFGTLAEYMLWDNYLKEYHEDMNFDLLWGNDIVSQDSKHPEQIIQDNQNLTNYNINFKEGEQLSILKTYNNQDGDFNFEFAQFDQLNFNEEMVDNQLTALIAYYAYLIIGLDLDSFSPMGGEDVLQRCLNLTNNAQNLNFTGWKAFDNDRNRFAIINDYLDGAMKPFRQLQYDYYRTGLDEMANNADRGRTNISTALQTHLKKVHEDKPLSMLPQIWTDYKKDELSNIYKGKGTQKEKEAVYEVLFSINASQSNYWDKIKE